MIRRALVFMTSLYCLSLPATAAPQTSESLAPAILAKLTSILKAPSAVDKRHIALIALSTPPAASISDTAPLRAELLDTLRLGLLKAVGPIFYIGITNELIFSNLLRNGLDLGDIAADVPTRQRLLKTFNVTILVTVVLGQVPRVTIVTSEAAEEIAVPIDAGTL